jgi:hypothetical protein
MSIQVREVSGKAELRKFIYLPAQIHRNHANWVPPIYMDDWEYFNPKKNKSFSYCDTILLLAWKDKKPVGRIMGIINRPYNEQHIEKHARFSWMEAENDPDVYAALMKAMETWAGGHGMTHLVGPLGFSDKDPQGFQTAGFDEPVLISSTCSFPYMIDLTEQYGFKPKADLVTYKIYLPETLPPVYYKVAERFAKRETNLKVLEFTSRRKLKPYIHRALGLINQTFTEIYGFYPYTEKEMDDFANRFLYLINPRFIKLMINEKQEIIALGIGMSDISKGIQKAKGHLLPFGWIPLFRESKRSKQLNLLLGAIRPDYRGRGIDSIITTKMIESARKTGKIMMDSHLILESTTKMRAEWERTGGYVNRRFRIYQKPLAL